MISVNRHEWNDADHGRGCSRVPPHESPQSPARQTPNLVRCTRCFRGISARPHQGQHINDQDRRRLYNACRPMAVVVKRLSNDARKIGLTEHRLWLAAVTHLRPVGLYSDPYDRAKTDGPVLYVSAHVFGSAFNVSVEYHKGGERQATGWGQSGGITK